MNNTVNVAKDFYPRPTGRFYDDGKYSGQSFRENILEDEKLVVDFTGVSMAGSSFLEESFGGLVRIDGFNKTKLLGQLDLVVTKPLIKDKILSYIEKESELKVN